MSKTQKEKTMADKTKPNHAINISFNLGTATIDMSDADEFESYFGEGDLRGAVVLCIARELLRKYNSGYNRDDESLFKGAVEEAVRSVAAEMVEARLADTVNEVLEEGFEQTDTFGRVNGKTTVRDIVIEHLRKPRDSYNWWLKKCVEDQLTPLVKREFGAEVAQVRETIKTLIDEQSVGKIRKAIADALGVRL